jgi:hypothetical protein
MTFDREALARAGASRRLLGRHAVKRSRADALLRHADLAMYDHKRATRAETR